MTAKEALQHRWLNEEESGEEEEFRPLKSIKEELEEEESSEEESRSFKSLKEELEEEESGEEELEKKYIDSEDESESEYKDLGIKKIVLDNLDNKCIQKKACMHKIIIVYNNREEITTKPIVCTRIAHDFGSYLTDKDYSHIYTSIKYIIGNTKNISSQLGHLKETIGRYKWVKK